MRKNIDMKSFYQKASNESLIIIDVRDPEEYALKHVANAVNIPLDLLSKHMVALNEDETYYILCKTGVRSEKAADYLLEHGFNAISVDDGIEAWPGDLTHSSDFTALL